MTLHRVIVANYLKSIALNYYRLYFCSPKADLKCFSIYIVISSCHNL